MNIDALFAEVEAERPAFRQAWADSKPAFTIARNVYQLRKAHGWTQTDLAARAGMRQPRIAEIERGDVDPKLSTLSRIAAALGVLHARLFAEEEEAASTVSELLPDFAPVFVEADADLIPGYASHPQFARIVNRPRHRAASPIRSEAAATVLFALSGIERAAKANVDLFEQGEPKGWAGIAND